MLCYLPLLFIFIDLILLVLLAIAFGAAPWAIAGCFRFFSRLKRAPTALSIVSNLRCHLDLDIFTFHAAVSKLGQ